MRNLLAIALVLLVAGCGGETDEAGPQVEAAAVEDAVLAFFDALENMDFQALDTTVTPDFELVERTSTPRFRVLSPGRATGTVHSSR